MMRVLLMMVGATFALSDTADIYIQTRGFDDVEEFIQVAIQIQSEPEAPKESEEPMLPEEPTEPRKLAATSAKKQKLVTAKQAVTAKEKAVAAAAKKEKAALAMKEKAAAAAAKKEKAALAVKEKVAASTAKKEKAALAMKEKAAADKEKAAAAKEAKAAVAMKKLTVERATKTKVLTLSQKLKRRTSAILKQKVNQLLAKVPGIPEMVSSLIGWYTHDFLMQARGSSEGQRQFIDAFADALGNYSADELTAPNMLHIVHGFANRTNMDEGIQDIIGEFDNVFTMAKDGVPEPSSMFNVISHSFSKLGMPPEMTSFMEQILQMMGDTFDGNATGGNMTAFDPMKLFGMMTNLYKELGLPAEIVTVFDEIGTMMANDKQDLADPKGVIQIFKKLMKTLAMPDAVIEFVDDLGQVLSSDKDPSPAQIMAMMGNVVSKMGGPPEMAVAFQAIGQFAEQASKGVTPDISQLFTMFAKNTKMPFQEGSTPNLEKVFERFEENPRMEFHPEALFGSFLQTGSDVGQEPRALALKVGDETATAEGVAASMEDFEAEVDRFAEEAMNQKGDKAAFERARSSIMKLVESEKDEASARAKKAVADEIIGSIQLQLSEEDAMEAAVDEFIEDEKLIGAEAQATLVTVQDFVDTAARDPPTWEALRDAVKRFMRESYMDPSMKESLKIDTLFPFVDRLVSDPVKKDTLRKIMSTFADKLAEEGGRLQQATKP